MSRGLLTEISSEMPDLKMESSPSNNLWFGIRILHGGAMRYESYVKDALRYSYHRDYVGCISTGTTIGLMKSVALYISNIEKELP
ncbi:hypothetical protein NDU88_003027 [Pleurodeles waltl]|uniref:Uncharacterized protein n=1 Tax=Pleurodeles waltl TaxID=8319 RepID=A0AAV7W198_PLEWA|nr:hypothetical protein NDU88_003027 [Pleurodeles waltl]